MSGHYFYEPSTGHGLRHDPIKAIIAPRPIGWISSRSRAGVPNLAPYSYFNIFNAAPPIIGFASVGWKDSAANIAAAGEFAWNLATRPLAGQMNETSGSFAPDVDEFALAGLTPIASNRIDAPRVGESPASFECRLTQIVQLETKEQTMVDTWLILGEVVGVHIAPDTLQDGVYQTARAEPIMRAGGPTSYYAVTQAAEFHLRRPSGST